MYYCDTAATMPLLNTVKEVISEHLNRFVANPSSDHEHGQQAKRALKEIHEAVSQRLGVLPLELIWTSGATEANNLAIHTAVETLRSKHQRVTLYYHPLAHKSLIEPALALAKHTASPIFSLPLDLKTGRLAVERVQELVNDPQASLLLLPFGNNELGWLDPLTSLWPWVKEHGPWIHLDAAQALGKIPLNLTEIPCQSMSFSGHKMGAPIGIGALFLRMRPRKVIKPLFLGGGQQEGRRAGTMPLMLIAAMGAALAYWNSKERNELKAMQQKVMAALQSLPSIRLLTDEKCLPHIITFEVNQEKSSGLKELASYVAYSKGSACNAHAAEGSHILSYLGYNIEQQKRICRLSLGLHLTQNDVDFMIEKLKKIFGESFYE